MQLKKVEDSNFTITICIVNFNTADFILNSLYCLEKLTKNKYKVIIRDNNSKFKDFLKLKKKINKFSNVQLYRVENFNLTGSIAHGIAINDLITKIDTKYGVILDADCIFLIRNWDEILINEINEVYPIIGTQAVLGGGSKKYDDFPLMYGILFSTDVLKSLQIDFKPENVEDNRDTGFKLRELYLKKGYKGKLLYGRNTRFFTKGPFNKIICMMFYKNGIDEIFACHFGRGSSLGRAKYMNKMKKNGTKGNVKLIYKIPFMGNRLVKSKGRRERQKWIKICRRIVDNYEN